MSHLYLFLLLFIFFFSVFNICLFVSFLICQSSLSFLLTFLAFILLSLLQPFFSYFIILINSSLPHSFLFLLSSFIRFIVLVLLYLVPSALLSVILYYIFLHFLISFSSFPCCSLQTLSCFLPFICERWETSQLQSVTVLSWGSSPGRTLHLRVNPRVNWIGGSFERRIRKEMITGV